MTTTQTTTVTTAGASTRPAAAAPTTAAGVVRARLQSWRWPIAGVLALLLSVAVTALLTPERSAVRFAPDSPEPDGGQALAQVLEDQGVDVTSTTSVAEAIGAAGPGTTLLVANDYGMTDDVARSLLETGATIALVAPGDALLAAATAEVTHARRSPDPAPTVARCTDPDARAAGSITSLGTGFEAAAEPDDAPSTSGGAVLCFTSEAGASHYAVFPSQVVPTSTDGAGTTAGSEVTAPVVRALDDAGPLTNEQITTEGNAAIGLRMLGHEERLVWLIPERPVAALEGGGIGDLLPPWAGALLAQLAVIALVCALWRGRRLGPLVAEDLPVTVPSSETALGRGRLYRRARAWGHAAAALRAGAAHRMATRLGVPRSAGAPTVIDAITRATHRPSAQVAGLLYGPPPADDADLARLAIELDQLESEVHRA
ncbi:DUF4350 domain-containing protein [Sanguibacter sp. 25GB23B1]|uniref:DUF4350 domain-containing protein n=1 Tax=unclassified Sanguibacter TaxID=2645534 RepID=UPI0032AECFBE